jgi:hypothetical protein
VGGVWYTTGGGGGILTVAGIVAAVEGAEWVLAYLWLIIAVGLACLILSAVLALAVVPRLTRWRDRRDAEAYAAIRPAQAIPLASPPSGPAVPWPQRQAIAPPQVVNFNFYGVDADRAAALIRQALPGTAGERDADRNAS